MIAPTRSAIRRLVVDSAPVSAELPRRPIEPKPTISETLADRLEHTPQPGRRSPSGSPRPPA
jgi:hypothetical protein